MNEKPAPVTLNVHDACSDTGAEIKPAPVTLEVQDVTGVSGSVVDNETVAQLQAMLETEDGRAQLAEDMRARLREQGKL